MHDQSIQVVEDQPLSSDSISSSPNSGNQIQSQTSVQDTFPKSAGRSMHDQSIQVEEDLALSSHSIMQVFHWG